MTGQRKRRRGLLDLEPARPAPIRQRNPWPKCPGCFRRVPELCITVPDGAHPCGFGISCGCCFGPHQPVKQHEDD